MWSFKNCLLWEKNPLIERMNRAGKSYDKKDKTISIVFMKEEDITKLQQELFAVGIGDTNDSALAKTIEKNPAGRFVYYSIRLTRDEYNRAMQDNKAFDQFIKTLHEYSPGCTLS